MADNELVREILLEVNGELLTDFTAVTEGERVLRKAVKLHSKTAFVKVPPEYNITVDYNIPDNRPEFDFEGMQNGTLTIDRQNGTRITFSGVNVLSIGEAKYGGEDGPTIPVKMIADKRIVN